MKISNLKLLALCFTIFLTYSCQQNAEQSKQGVEVTEEEQEARDKVGNVYDDKVRGIEHENRDNQFPTSRNDNREGYGQSLGAPSDTVDNDGDKKVRDVKQEPR